MGVNHSFTRTPMNVREEVFLESDFDSRHIARQKRDERLAQLQGKGYACRAENLYTIHTGMRVFVVVALPPTEAADLPLLTVEQDLIPAPPSQVERLGATPKARPKAGKVQYQDRSHRHNRMDNQPDQRSRKHRLHSLLR